MRSCYEINSAFEPGEEGEHRLEVTDQNKAASSEVAGRKHLEISACQLTAGVSTGLNTIRSQGPTSLVRQARESPMPFSRFKRGYRRSEDR